MASSKQLSARFEEVFKEKGETHFFSPGRINLIGEHTDYNGGKVLPCTISLGTYAIVSKRIDREIHAFSQNLADSGIQIFSLENLTLEEENNWTTYIKGMLLYIQEQIGAFDHGFNLFVYGTLPLGASLASSASLEILIGVIVNELYGTNLSGETLATLGRRVENECLHLNSGIMDQFVIANGKKDHAMLLDTNTLAYEQIPLDLANHKIIIMNSLVQRELIDSEYNVRRKQCNEAVVNLQRVTSLSNLSELTETEFESFKYAISDDIVARRAKHVVYENKRTELAAKALKDGQLEVFGKLMNDSHTSLHEDYEVTIKETDLLVRLAWEQTGVLGARMTGAGFGGACIAIVENEYIKAFIENISRDFEKEIGYQPEFYIAETEDRAKKLSDENGA